MLGYLGGGVDYAGHFAGHRADGRERHVDVLYKTLFHTLGCTGFQVIGQVQTFHGIIVEDNHRYGIEVVSYLQVADYHIEAVGSQSGDTVKQRVGRYLHAG